MNFRKILKSRWFILAAMFAIGLHACSSSETVSEDESEINPDEANPYAASTDEGSTDPMPLTEDGTSTAATPDPSAQNASADLSVAPAGATEPAAVAIDPNTPQPALTKANSAKKPRKKAKARSLEPKKDDFARFESSDPSVSGNSMQMVPAQMPPVELANKPQLIPPPSQPVQPIQPIQAAQAPGTPPPPATPPPAQPVARRDEPLKPATHAPASVTTEDEELNPMEEETPFYMNKWTIGGLLIALGGGGLLYQLRLRRKGEV